MVYEWYFIIERIYIPYSSVVWRTRQNTTIGGGQRGIIHLSAIFKLSFFRIIMASPVREGIIADTIANYNNRIVTTLS